MTTQPDFFTENTIKDCPLPNGVTEADRADLRAHLMAHSSAWITRTEIAVALNWEVRKVRATAQTFGGEIIRGQLGYKLADACTRDDVPLMQQSADSAGSQSNIDRAYQLAVLKRIHSIVG